MPTKFTKLYAFSMIDHAGNESLVGIPAPNGDWLPLIDSNPERIDALTVFAGNVGKEQDCKIKLLTFKLETETNIDIETIPEKFTGFSGTKK